MLNKEEIEKAKEDLIFFNEGDYITREMDRSADVLEEYIDQLEQENKALKKGQTSLMSSRKKWRNRYYNLKSKNKEDTEGWKSVLDCAKFEINKREQEKDKANKVIDEMASYISNLDVDEDICKKVKISPCADETSVPVSYCIECVKQYFENKVEER